MDINICFTLFKKEFENDYCVWKNGGQHAFHFHCQPLSLIPETPLNRVSSHGKNNRNHKKTQKIKLSKQWFWKQQSINRNIVLCVISQPLTQYIPLLAVWSISYVRQNTQCRKGNIINAWQNFMGDILLCKHEKKQRCIRLISYRGKNMTGRH